MMARRNTAAFMEAMQHAAAHLLLAAEENPAQADEMRAVAAQLQVFALGGAASGPAPDAWPETVR